MKKTISFLVALLCLTTLTIQAQQRLVLVEEFTSSTCAPYCPQLNNLLNPWLVENAEKVVVVKYQMNFPGLGDPYYTAEGGTRRSYYSVNGVPSVFVNGATIGGGSIQQVFNNTVTNVNNAYTQPAQATIEGVFEVIGNMIYVETYVTPLISGDNYFIHCIVNEKVTRLNKMTNGETEFHHVMMKMFPNGNGTTLNLTAGETIPLKFYHDMSTTHVEEMDDLEVVVFVQNKSTKAVLNAIYLAEDNVTLAFPPENFTVTQVEETLNTNLLWNSVTGANGYNIYRDGIKLNTSPITETSYIDEIPEYGITYSYGVAAIINGTEGFMATATVLSKITIPAVNIISVKQLRGLQMQIEWEMPEFEYPVKYYVYRNGIPQNNASPTPETSFLNKGNTYTEYCFQVEPALNTLRGEKSSEMCITLINVASPTNFKAKQIAPATKEILLSWAASNNAVGYNIYRDNEQINNELITTLDFTDIVSEFDVRYSYQVFGVAENGGEGEKGALTSITLSETGINEKEYLLFTLFPNPVSGILNINTNEIINDCQIYNLQGQLIYSTQSDVKEISTDNWASGIYIIRIATEKGSAEKRFSKH